MPRNRATKPSPPPFDPYAWLSAFRDELQHLRPHVSLKLAETIGRAEFRPDIDPRAAAMVYHQRQGGTPPTPPAKAKRKK